MEILQKAYETACNDGDEEQAAYLIRKIRNKLLDESDKEMSLDRLGLDTTSITKFLTSLGSIFAGEWAVYRQALRDITAQEGFPYNVTFPEPPKEV